jgi:hypothetical protein
MFIRGLSNLVELSANYCNLLEEITTLPNVTRIIASGCRKLRVLDSLPNLSYLNGNECTNLTEIKGVPDTLQNANLINQNLKMLLLNNVPRNRGSNVFIKSQSNNYRIPSEINDNYYANISPIKTKHFINKRSLT